MDEVLPSSIDGCAVDARPVGDRLDINALGRNDLIRLFRLDGLAEERADSLAEAIVAYRDGGRRIIRDIRELTDALDGPTLAFVRRTLGTENEPISLNHAPAAVLLFLPGITDDVARGILDARRNGSSLRSYEDLADHLPTTLQHEVRDSFPALVGRSTLMPVAWALRTSATAGSPPIRVVTEVRIHRQDGSVVARRRRSWLE